MRGGIHPRPAFPKAKFLLWLLWVVPGLLFAQTDPAPETAPAPATTTEENGFSGLPIDPAKPVTVRFLSPKPDEILPTNEVDALVDVDNYQLSPSGNGIHVILDNHPPIRLDAPGAPAVFKNLSEGGHTLRVLAAKPDGFALADPGAYAMVHFYIRRRDFQNFVNPDAPYLTVNMPLGAAVSPGTDNRVWFDFRVHNAKLGKEDFHIRYKVNQTEAVIDEEKPVFWENLKPGRYQLTAELLDSTLQPVPGLFNHAVRSFEVEAAAVKALPVAPAPTAPASPPVPGPRPPVENQLPRD